MSAKTIASIKQSLYLLAAVVVVAMMGTLAFTVYSNSESAIRQEKNHLRTLATIIAANTGHVLEKNREVLERVAQRPQIQAMDPENCDPILADFRHLFPGFANLATVDLSGRAPCSGVPQPGGKPVSVAKTEWFRRAIREQRFLAGNPFVGPITGRWVSVLVEPVWQSDQKLLGFIGLPLDLANFDPHISSAPVPAGTRYGILGGDGILIWRNIDPEHLIGKQIGNLPAPRQTLAVRDGEFENTGTDGIERYYSVVPIEGVNWYAFVGVESRYVHAAIFRATLANSVLAIASLVVIAGLLIFLVRRIAQAEAELVRAKNEALAASRAKSIFLSNMSHELRTPLNAILGFTQIMERDPAIPENERNNLKTVSHSGRHLLSLINDILDISKIEAGRLVFLPQVCDLPELISSLAESMELRAKTKSLQFHVDIDPALSRYVETDAGKLRQVLLNLLSNAVKYTSRGEVRLHAHMREEESGPILTVSVRDTGMGISQEELGKIFEPFYQTEGGILTGEGTGLGLSIAKQFATLLGGSLEVKSVIGQGSVFTLRLPVKIAENFIPISPSKKHVVGLAAHQPSLKVLIAEDKPDNQRLLSQLMENAGFEVRAAANGLEAVEIFQEWQPHLIWMDMRMPVLDGYQATRSIRKLAGGERIPIVALTASAFEEDRAAIIEAGCSELVRKPLDADQLFEVMERLLGVKFDYAQETVEKEAKLDLPMLSEEVREKLAKAAQMLDLEAVRAVASEIENDHPEAARAIRRLADEYRFDLFQPPKT